MSTLSPAEVQYEQAHIYQQKSTTNIIVLSVFTFVAFVALCVRLASRKIQRAGFALDDYLIVIGMVRSNYLDAGSEIISDFPESTRFSRLSMS